MSAAANKKIIQDMFAEMAKGNLGAFLETVADDARWNVIGKSRFSGLFQGKQEIVEKLLAPLADQIDGNFTVTPENFLVDGDCVVMQARGVARTKSGGTYSNTYCIVYRLAGGKIIEGTEYLDTEAVTSAFGR